MTKNRREFVKLTVMISKCAVCGNMQETVIPWSSIPKCRWCGKHQWEHKP